MRKDASAMTLEELQQEYARVTGEIERVQDEKESLTVKIEDLERRRFNIISVVNDRLHAGTLTGDEHDRRCKK